MQHRLSHFVSLALVVLLISGCVGAGTVTGSPHAWDIKDSGKFGLCPIKYDKMIVSCSKTRLPNFPNASVEEITPDKLIEMWGPPKSNVVINGLRELTYEQTHAWRGVVVFLVIPIPLLVPLGHNEAKFSFQDDHLVHVEYIENWLNAAVCGLHSEGPNGFGCIAGWH